MFTICDKKKEEPVGWLSKKTDWARIGIFPLFKIKSNTGELLQEERILDWIHSLGLVEWHDETHDIVQPVSITIHVALRAVITFHWRVVRCIR